MWLWWKITVVVGHPVRAPTSTLRLHLLALMSRVPISRQRVSWHPGGNTPWESCRTTGRISHTEASDLPPSLRGQNQGNGPSDQHPAWVRRG